MSPEVAALALLQLVFLAAIGWVVANAALARAVRGELPGLGLPERALASVAGFVAFSVGLMVLHIVLRGIVFGTPGVVVVAGATVVLLGRRSLRLLPRPRRALIASGVVLVALFVLPVLIGGSGVRVGDSSWHMGWSEQLLAGERLPTGPAPEFGRNAYPWGFHCVIATLVRLVPGSDPLVAHEALHVLFVFAIPLGAACLARRLHSHAGWPAAAAASLIGGFGWVLARRADFVPSPSHARYGADMMVASPNAVYELFPPAFPRELGLILVAAAGVLVALAVAGAPRLSILAGAVLGLTGLVSPPMLFTGALWTAAAALIADRETRRSLLVAGLLVGGAVFALWLGPLAMGFVRFGGFVNVSPMLGVEWPLGTALSSWGLLLPLAIAGIGLAVQKRGPEARAVLAFALVPAALLVLAEARRALEWSLAGNQTALHQGRFWPVAHLLAAAFAGPAILAAFRWIELRSRQLAVAALAALFVVGVASLALSSGSLTALLLRGAHGFVYGQEDYAKGSFLRRAARHLGPQDVLDVRGSPKSVANDLAFDVFEFSGVRLARYDDPRLDGNDLRIRFSDLAQAWNRQMARGGFEADYEIVPAARAPRGREIEKGTYEGEEWALLRVSREGDAARSRRRSARRL